MKKFFGILVTLVALAQPAHAMEKPCDHEKIVIMPKMEILKQVFIQHSLDDFVTKTDIVERLSEKKIMLISIFCEVGRAIRAYLDGSFPDKKEINLGNKNYVQTKNIVTTDIYDVIHEVLKDQLETSEIMNHINETCERDLFGKTLVCMPAQEQLEQFFIQHGLKDVLVKTTLLKSLCEKDKKAISIAGDINYASWAYYRNQPDYRVEDDQYTVENDISFEDKIYALLDEILENQPLAREVMHASKDVYRDESFTFSLIDGDENEEVI